jgi:DNA-binding NarL/FixJ family response regulator
MIRIALVEDDQLLSKRLVFFLNSQKTMQCILVANSLGRFFEQLTDDLKPDLLLMDIELSDTINTIEHLKKIKSLLPQSKILVITGHNHPQYMYRALQNGAHGFYLKGSGLAKLLQAIQTTHEGGSYLAPEAAALMLPLISGEESAIDSSPLSSTTSSVDAHDEQTSDNTMKHLSQREKEVARGLIDGATYQEIASSSNISINTVRHYVKILYKKFDVSNKIQLGQKLRAYF